MEALQVAGGLILVLVGLELPNPAPSDVDAETAARRNVTLVPLGDPTDRRPGSVIAATMLYMQQADTLGGMLSVVLALIGVLAIV